MKLAGLIVLLVGSVALGQATQPSTRPAKKDDRVAVGGMKLKHESPDFVQGLWKSLAARRAALVSEYKEEAATYRKLAARADGKSQREEYRNKQRDAERKLAAINRLGAIPWEPLYEVAVGRIGVANYGRATVVQVVDARNALVRIHTIGRAGGFQPNVGGEGVQLSPLVVPPMPTESDLERPSDQIVWLRGFSTEGMVDGEVTTIIGNTPLRATGTTSYESTRGGPTTVVVLEAFDIEPYLEKAKP